MLRLAFVALICLVVAVPSEAARRRTSSGPIERETLSDPDFCASGEGAVPSGEFTADGPEVTIEFCARNLGVEDVGQRAAGGNSLWMYQRLDAISLIESAFYYAILDSLPCHNCIGVDSIPRVDWLSPHEYVYLETFANGIPPEWFLGDGAYEVFDQTPTEQTSENDLDAPDCVNDRSGTSLGLGDVENPLEIVRTYATIPGLFANVDYHLNYWWNARADSSDTNGDLWFKVWGYEPWEEMSVPELEPSSETWSTAWADIDGDGDDDVFLSRSAAGGAPDQLLRNDGNFNFTDITPPSLDDGDLHSVASFADYDNDGDQDLYLGTWVGTSKLMRNDGGDFVDSGMPGIAGPILVTKAAWADYDLDGDLDLFVSSPLNPNRLHRNDGTSFANVTSGPLLGSSESAEWGDFDDDGDPDLLIARGVNANRLARNDGNGSFVNVAAGTIGASQNSRAAAWGDYDHDGRLDLALGNGPQASVLLRNLGGGVFGNASPAVLDDTTTTLSMTFRDIDLDRDSDLLIGNYAGKRSLAYKEPGANWEEGIGGPFPMSDPDSSSAFVFSDLDGDGDLDAIVPTLVGPDRIFRNDHEPEYLWLQVELEGTASNRDGVGAKIEVTSGGVTQRRDYGFTGGGRSQGTRIATFGLGGSIFIDEVRVTWPSGVVQVVNPTFPAFNQRLTIVEADPTPSPGPAAGARFALYAPSPNPTAERCEVRFEVPREAPVSLRVFDVSGRRVRTLAARPFAAGAHSVAWDGRDDAGERAGSGVYFVRLEAAGHVATEKVLLRRGAIR